MKRGDVLRDNDPRMQPRVLMIEVVTLAEDGSPLRVRVIDRAGRLFRIAAKRIHCDGKTRRSGFDLEPK